MNSNDRLPERVIQTSLASFTLMPKNIPRILIIGESGIGKSSLCNKLSGIYYKKTTKKCASGRKVSSINVEDHKTADYVPEEPIFESKRGKKSVTDATSWAQVIITYMSFCSVCVLFSICKYKKIVIL